VVADIKKPYGSSYRAMLAEVREVLTNSTLFPALKGRPLELAGFVWPGLERSVRRGTRV